MHTDTHAHRGAHTYRPPNSPSSEAVLHTLRFPRFLRHRQMSARLDPSRKAADPLGLPQASAATVGGPAPPEPSAPLAGLLGLSTVAGITGLKGHGHRAASQRAVATNHFPHIHLPGRGSSHK